VKSHAKLALTAVAAFAAACAAMTAASAQTFPTKPITLIVPWPAGGSTDISMRAMAEAAGKDLGQPVVVENKAGASGTLGPATLRTAKPDGYTIAQMPVTMFRLPLMKDKKVSWDPKTDFTYICHLSGYTFGITTKADGPIKDWAGLLEYAKANPGKVTYASPGAGTSLHLGMEQIASRAGVQFTHVPFKGGAETNAAVLGGHTTLQADSTGWRSLVDAGQLRLLVLWTEKRSKFWPDVPTLRDVGLDMVFDSPWGIAGPKGMDPAIVKRIDQAFKKALDDPKVQEVLDGFVFPVRYADQAGYLKIIDEVTQQEREGLAKIGLGR
jgi:tripartite-type tricarboxylate transporter receptor subunit TctC